MNRPFRNIAILAIALAASTVVALWTWNTLAEPFGGPEIAWRHAAAMIAAACLLRLVIGGRRHRGQSDRVCERGHHHG